MIKKGIEPSLRIIGDYFRKNVSVDSNLFFEIPEFQRPYSWNIEKCEKLWQDILDTQQRSEGEYFFGTMIINCEKNKDKDSLQLIDGQQRTITFLLLLKAFLLHINDAIKENQEDNKIKLGLQDYRRNIINILYKINTKDIANDFNEKEDGEMYSKYSSILKTKSIREDKDYREKELSAILEGTNYNEIENKVYKKKYKQKDNKYTNFFKNFKYFYDKLNDNVKKEWGNASVLFNIAEVFITKCVVIEIKIWDPEQAIAMFNSLNSDGMPLDDSDIIYAKLYNKAYSDKDIFEKKWETLEDNIKALNNHYNKLKENIFNITSILTQQMYYNRAESGEIKRKEAESVDVAVPSLRKHYVDKIKEEIYKPMELCNNMIKLVKIWYQVLSYPIIQVLTKFNSNVYLFLACYLYRFKDKIEIIEEGNNIDIKDNIDKDSITTICECLLRLFTILALDDRAYSTNEFKVFLFKESLKLVNDKITIEEIRKDFIDHINKNWNRIDLGKRIIEYNDNNLIFLNEYLFAKEHNKKFDLNLFHDIEHIMPQSGRNISEIRKDANIQTDEEWNKTINKIGNKIVLESDINRSIGNAWFRTKISTTIEDKTGYINSKFPIANYLVEKYGSEKDKPYWTKEDIDNATEEAKNRILNFIFEK